VKKRILAACDETAVAKVLKDRLIHWGYEVDTAFDGEETMQKFGSFKPDLLLLDLKMPKMSGMRVQEESKRRRLGLSIFILSVAPSEAEMCRCPARGADDYIFKPFDKWRVRKSVERILSFRRERTDHEQP
jgi:two-component system response regulator VicR